MEEIEINPLEDIPICEGNNPWVIEASTYDICNISYNDFFNHHMIKNIPCIVKNISTNWECSQKWINSNTINYDYLSNEYGDLVAPVANCHDVVYDSHSKCDMKVSDYMNYLRNDLRSEVLYLKDWHLKRSRPEDNFYTIPKLFASDWLNEMAQDQQKDDFMFVYIGPKDSWTPLHADVYSSYSWSVNVVGRKKWIIFPPGEEEKLKDGLGNLPLMFDSEQYKNVTCYEISQEKGDAIYVPSGWYHQVVNQLDTISINHNWINGCNILAIWKALIKALDRVEHEIEEFRDTPEFPSQCQLILKTYHGMDCESFVKFVMHIAEKRLAQLQGVPSTIFNKYSIGVNHIKFDLKCLSDVMNLIAHHLTFINKYINIEDNFYTLKDNLLELF